MEIAQVLDDHQVRSVTRRHRPAVVQAIVLSRHQRRVAHGRGWGHAGRHQAPQQAIQVAVPAQIVGEDIIRHQAPGIAQLPGHQERQQGIKVAGTGAFAHLDEHT